MLVTPTRSRSPLCCSTSSDTTAMSLSIRSMSSLSRRDENSREKRRAGTITKTTKKQDAACVLKSHSTPPEILVILQMTMLGLAYTVRYAEHLTFLQMARNWRSVASSMNSHQKKSQFFSVLLHDPSQRSLGVPRNQAVVADPVTRQWAQGHAKAATGTLHRIDLAIEEQAVEQSSITNEVRSSRVHSLACSTAITLPSKVCMSSFSNNTNTSKRSRTFFGRN